MKPIAKNRPLAIAALVLVIAGGITGGTFRSVRGAERKLEAAFASSSEAYVSVKPQLTKVSAAAHDLLNAYEKIQGAQDSDSRSFAALLTTFDSERDTPYLTVTPEGLRAAGQILYNAVADSDTEKADAKYAYQSLKSYAAQLAKNDEYNKAAAAYNGNTAAFPASLVRRGGDAVTFNG